MFGTPKSGDYTLLVVDDLEENRDLLSRRLRREGFGVVTAASGAEALRVLATSHIDLVVLDVMMPEMSGLEVLRAMRDDPARASIPVIMATARTDSADVVEALDLGANDYVTKPIDFPVLNARIQVALRSRARAATTNRGGELVPGAVLGRRYRLDAKIGEGGFGVVFRAVHTELQRDVAIKVLHPSFATGSLLGRFRLEGMHACRVHHPNALQVLDSGITDDGIAFLAMELLAGHSLEHELTRGAMPYVRCAQILSPVCEALAAAHAAGIVHRDVKPANIFLHHGPDGETPKVLDFGIAKLVGETAAESRMTLDGSLVGTPAYMAPERFLNKPYDGRSDVYSVGILLSQMICGALPFASASTRLAAEPVALALMHTEEPPIPLRARDPDIPEALEDVVLRTLAKDPAQRPTAGELADELLRAVDGVSADAKTAFAVPVLGLGSSGEATAHDVTVHDPTPLEPTRSIKKHTTRDDPDDLG